MTDIAGIVLDAEGWRLTDVRLEPEDRVVARYEAADGAGWINVVLMPKDAPRRKLGRLGHCSVYYEGELAERSFEHRARAADLVATVAHAAEARLERSGLAFPQGLAALAARPARVRIARADLCALLPELEAGPHVHGFRLLDAYPGLAPESYAFELGTRRDDRRVVISIEPRADGGRGLAGSTHFHVEERHLLGSQEGPAPGACAAVALTKLLLALRDDAKLSLEPVRPSEAPPPSTVTLGAPAHPEVEPLAKEARALRPTLEAASKFFGEPVVLRRIEAAPAEAYAVTFPSVAASHITPYYRAPHALVHRRVLRDYFASLGFAIHDDGLVRTVPTPESLVTLLAAHGVRTLAFRPRVFVGEAQRLTDEELLDLFLEGTLGVSLGSAELYAGAEPALRLGVGHGYWLEHFTGLAHDMSLHALATHRVPASAACELSAMVGPAARTCIASGRPDALEPLLAFYEGDVTQVCQEIWETVAHPDAFASVFERSMHRLAQRARRRIEESDTLRSRAPAPRARIATLARHLDPARSALLRAGRTVARWFPRTE
ncbi:MAG: hypothetical protein KC776_18500 [Myxococcales bacterium]|nr:hypothetical protein [Myxococcales bacterium]MCB9580238.1 hypothetical protein [Polyangiaceae bacterium]